MSQARLRGAGAAAAAAPAAVKGYESPKGATTGLAPYQVEGVRNKRRARLRARKSPNNDGRQS